MRKFYCVALTCALILPGAFHVVGQSRDTGAKSTDPNETILKYEAFLRKETEAHRQYTAEYYERILNAIYVLVGVAGALIAGLGWKTKADIKKEVDRRFNETVQDILEEKFDATGRRIENNIAKFDKHFKLIKGFFFMLTAARPELTANTLIDESLKNVQVDGDRQIAGKKILWVDDTPSNNNYPKLILENAGIEIDNAPDTAPAIELLQKKRYNLVVSDMGRPSSDQAGLELLNDIKKYETIRKLNPEIPVIIYAGTDGIRYHGKAALEQGAVAATASVPDVLNIIQKILTGDNTTD